MMCAYIDVKYINMCSSLLEKFKQKTSSLWNFRCPYCGDSKKYPLCDGSHRKLEGIQPVRIWFHDDLTVSFSREKGKLQLKLEKLEEN